MPKSSKQTNHSLAKTVRGYSYPLNNNDYAEMDNACVKYGCCRGMFFNQFCGVRSIEKVESFRKERDVIRKDGLNVVYMERYQFGAKYWVCALADTCANVLSMWANLANKIREVAADNDNIDDDELHYIRFVLKFPILWHGVLICNPYYADQLKKKYRKAYDKVLAAIADAQLKHANSYIRRLTRRYKASPHKVNRENRSMTFDDSMYRFLDDTKVSLMSTQRGKPVKIKLNGSWHYREKGNVQIILDRNKHRIEIHKLVQTHTKELPLTKPVGIDKGYHTLLSCSSQNEYGVAIGKDFTTEIERLAVRNANRQRAASKDYPTGKQKYTNQKLSHQAYLESLINQAVRQFIVQERPSMVVKEDLTFTEPSDNGYKTKAQRKQARKMNSWMKGYLNDRIEYICDMYNIPYVDVNPAYTSQYCPYCHQHFVVRYGLHNEKVSCKNCGNLNANTAAAVNILNRRDDKEITLYTPYKKVKKIMDARAKQALSNS